MYVLYSIIYTPTHNNLDLSDTENTFLLLRVHTENVLSKAVGEKVITPTEMHVAMTLISEVVIVVWAPVGPVVFWASVGRGDMVVSWIPVGPEDMVVFWASVGPGVMVVSWIPVGPGDMVVF